MPNRSLWAFVLSRSRPIFSFRGSPLPRVPLVLGILSSGDGSSRRCPSDVGRGAATDTDGGEVDSPSARVESRYCFVWRILEVSKCLLQCSGLSNSGETTTCTQGVPGKPMRATDVSRLDYRAAGQHSSFRRAVTQSGSFERYHETDLFLFLQPVPRV